MSAQILARAYEPGRGMCNAESIGGDWFRLIPDHNPNDRILRHRDNVKWRRA